MHGSIRIVRGGVARLPELRPLWDSLHAQHLSVDPRLPDIPMYSLQNAWPGRLRLYQQWLSENDAFLLLAEDQGRAVGYALAHFHDADESWDTHGRFGVLESLAVIPHLRREGVGAQLLAEVYAELRRLEVKVLEIGVLATNEEARRFYERQGFSPWMIHYLATVPKP